MLSTFEGMERNAQHGKVFKKSLGHYYVQSNGQVVTCSISNRLRKVLVYPTADPASLRPIVREVRDIHLVDPVAVGDEVAYTPAGHETGLITTILPRRNQLSRPAAGKKPLEQVIVSNVDQVIPVMAAAQPEPKWNLLDRYLTAAESAGIPALVLVTKADLLTGAETLQELELYRRLGYPVLLTSAHTGQGLDALRQALQGKMSVFVGKSGVGKSSILNAIQPGLGIRVNAVSQSTGKGKHTTTHLEMFALEFGGSVVDTPGMREFAVGGSELDDIALLFPEMRPLVGQCKFGLDCQHLHEPGCAIRSAVASGQISPRRYESYLKIREAG